MLRNRGFALLVTSLVAVAGVGMVFPRPSHAADTVIFISGRKALMRVPVSEFETFAQTGKPSGIYRAFMAFVSPEQQDSMRDLLGNEFTVHPGPFNQFLDSNLGSFVFNELGEILRPYGTSQSSARVLRTAFQTAAATGRFTLVDVLKSYPTANVLLDIKPALRWYHQTKTFGGDFELLQAAFRTDENTTNPNLDINSFLSLGACTESEGATYPSAPLGQGNADPPTGYGILSK